MPDGDVTLYDVLGLRKTATRRMIVRAAEAALADASSLPSDEALARRSEVRAALAVLSDARAREAYDRLLVADLPDVDWSGGKPPAGFVPLGEDVDRGLLRAAPTVRVWDAGAWMNARMADAWRGASLRATTSDLGGLDDLAPGHLWSLDASNRPVTDADLAHVAPHIGLVRLRLERTKVTDAGLTHLAGLALLQDLDLDDTAVGDGCVEVLAGLPNLRVLSLQNTRVSDAGVRQLVGVRSLAELHLRGVTGVSIDALVALAGLPKLGLLSTPKLGWRQRLAVEKALSGVTVIP
jgi:hypothetical protein